MVTGTMVLRSGRDTGERTKNDVRTQSRLPLRDPVVNVNSARFPMSRASIGKFAGRRHWLLHALIFTTREPNGMSTWYLSTEIAGRRCQLSRKSGQANKALCHQMMNVSSRCHTPYTASNDAPGTSLRCARRTSGRMITFTLPVSSSIVMKMTCVAVAGYRRTVTMPHPRPNWPLPYLGTRAGSSLCCRELGA